MRATWGYSVIMPNSQQCQHPSRKGPMYGQVRTHNTMPVFDRTTGSNSELPSREQRLCYPFPGRFNAFRQVGRCEVKHRTTLPCPCQQMDSLRSQLLKQNQSGFDFSVTSMDGEDTSLLMSTEYHHLQEGVQLLQQVANPISNV